MNWQRLIQSPKASIFSLSKLRIRQAKSLQNPLFRLHDKESPRESLPRGFVVLLWPWKLIFFLANQLFTQLDCFPFRRRISISSLWMSGTETSMEVSKYCPRGMDSLTLPQVPFSLSFCPPYCARKFPGAHSYTGMSGALCAVSHALGGWEREAQPIVSSLTRDYS